PGLVYRTDDNGATWLDQRRHPFGDLPPLAEVAAASASSAWFVGQAGTILHTADGGAAVVRQSGPTTVDPTSVAAAAARVRRAAAAADGGAWAAGEGALFLRTDDGGATWRVQRPADPDLDSGQPRISAVSPSVAWAVARGNRVFRTVDGGATWSRGTVSPGEDF